MAFRHDIANNWIRVDLAVDLTHYDDSADYLVRIMNNYAPRTCIKIGTSVRLSHIAMSAALFDRIKLLHARFPAFRMSEFHLLKARNILGMLCGITVYRNDNLQDCIQFQYTDVLARDTDAMIDPVFINHPKGAPSPFIYS